MAYAGTKRKRGFTSKRGTKRSFKRRRMAPARGRSFAKRVKAVVLKTSETKCYSRPFAAGGVAGVSVFHNQTYLVDANMMGLTRGPNEDLVSSRVGDEVYARGLRITLTHKAFNTCPDQYFRWWLVKGTTNVLPATLPMKNVNNNILLDAVDTELIKVVASGMWRSHGANETDSLAFDKITYKKIWYNCKNIKIKYQGTSNLQWPFEYGLYVAGFWSQGPSSGNPTIGHITGQTSFYFKDP